MEPCSRGSSNLTVVNPDLGFDFQEVLCSLENHRRLVLGCVAFQTWRGLSRPGLPRRLGSRDRRSFSHSCYLIVLFISLLVRIDVVPSWFCSGPRKPTRAGPKYIKSIHQSTLQGNHVGRMCCVHNGVWAEPSLPVVLQSELRVALCSLSLSLPLCLCHSASLPPSLPSLSLSGPPSILLARPLPLHVSRPLSVPGALLLSSSRQEQSPSPW